MGENRLRLLRIFGAKRGEVAGGWRRLHDEELRNLYTSTIYYSGLGPTGPPIQWVLGILFLEVKRPGREADHSPPSTAEVKNA
jgi:hypothetical protein